VHGRIPYAGFRQSPDSRHLAWLLNTNLWHAVSVRRAGSLEIGTEEARLGGKNPQNPSHLPMKLSVISPTYNESENVGRLISELEKSLQSTDHEILISDDNSPDLTWAQVEEIGRSNPRVRALRRTSNPGLGASVVDGFTSAAGEAVACIDADLQHDPTILPQMLKELTNGADLVVATRYMPGGSTANWGMLRRLGSWGCTKLAQVLIGVKLRDPMSGYFMMRRDDFLKIRDRLNVRGFKILLEIAAHMRPQRTSEVPYSFGLRVRGESKLSKKIVFAYLSQVWRLYRQPRIADQGSSADRIGGPTPMWSSSSNPR
jgi:dolichol-phosphate mannosyltransferase